MIPKALTIEEIGEKLKNMIVGEGKYQPMAFVSFLVKNPNYDPTNFSQEIEDSEEKIDILDILNEMLVEMKKPGFDVIWNNTLHGVKTNSKRWRENHSYKCQITFIPNCLLLQSEIHKNGARDFYSEDNINKIKTILEKYNEIYDFR